MTVHIVVWQCGLFVRSLRCMLKIVFVVLLLGVF